MLSVEIIGGGTGRTGQRIVENGEGGLAGADQLAQGVVHVRKGGQVLKKFRVLIKLFFQK